MRNVLRMKNNLGPSGGGVAEGRARRILSVILKIILRVVVVLLAVMLLS